MQYIVSYNHRAWEGEDVVFNNITEARNFFYEKAQDGDIRRVKMWIEKDDGKIYEIMDCDKALWTIAVKFFDKGADVHWYRTESYEIANEYFELCIKDKTIKSAVMYLENTKEKIVQARWARDIN